MISIYFLTLSLLAAQVSAAPLPCADNSGCFPFEYCWNAGCRELPVAMWVGVVPGYEDFVVSEETPTSDDPIEGLSAACSTPADCIGGDRCEGGQCRIDACVEDAQCGYKEICRRQSDGGHCLAAECTHDYHCDAGKHCRGLRCR